MQRLVNMWARPATQRLAMRFVGQDKGTDQFFGFFGLSVQSNGATRSLGQTWHFAWHAQGSHLYRIPSLRFEAQSLHCGLYNSCLSVQSNGKTCLLGQTWHIAWHAQGSPLYRLPPLRF